MSNISQLQYFKNIDPPPLQINISPPDHVMLGHVLFELVKTNQFLNGVISLQDVIDLAYVTQGDIRASFATLSLLGPRMSHPSFKVTNISTKNTSFVKWAKCQGYWGDALDVIEGIGMRSEDQPLVIELTTSSNAIINMTSSVSQVEKLESNQINQSEEYDFSLHCPIITFIEPKVIDRFIGGAIRIFGCNFLQKTPNSPNIIPLLVVLDGFGEFEPIIYSDSEIGLTLPPYKTDDIQLPTRIPTVTFRVTVKITSAYGCLSSNLCDINPFWVAFADSRIPQERSSSTSIPLLPEPNSGKQVVAPKSRINRKTVETSVESDDDDFEMDDVPKATSSVVRSKRCIIEDEDDDEDDGESPVTQSESCSENMNIIPSQLDIYDMMKRSLNDLKSHPLILPFLTPLDPLEYQDFYEIISVSMDLGTIESSISENLYHTFEEYINDVKLMFTNQLLYHEKGKDSNCLHQLQELLQSAKILEKYFHENIQIILSNPSYQTTSSCTEIQCNFSVSKPLILPSPPTSNDLARMESIAEKERKSLPLLLPFLESIPRRTFTLNFHNKSDLSHDDLHDIEALCEYCDITSDQDCLYGYLESHCDYYQSSLYDNLRLIDNEMMIINGSKLLSDDNFIDEDDDEEDMELSWWDYSKTINMIPGNEIFIIPSNLFINIRYSSRLLTSLSLIKLDKIRYQKYLILFKSLLNIPLSSRSLTNSFNYYLHKSSIICDILPWILSLCKLQQGITSTSRDMIPTTSMNTALHEDPYHTSSTSTTINRRSSRLSLKLFPSIQKYQRIRNLLHLSEEEVELLLTTFSFS